MQPYEVFYAAFGFQAMSTHAGLLVFSAWFGLIEFWLSPLQNMLSRKHEFEADDFAKATVGSADDLIGGLKRLREESRSVQ